jgi:hypothetical protein
VPKAHQCDRAIKNARYNRPRSLPQKVLRLPWLAPDITTAIINGRKPPQLTAQALMRLTPRLPANWTEQQKLLGFR